MYCLEAGKKLVRALALRDIYSKGVVSLNGRLM